MRLWDKWKRRREEQKRIKELREEAFEPIQRGIDGNITYVFTSIFPDERIKKMWKECEVENVNRGNPVGDL